MCVCMSTLPSSSSNAHPVSSRSTDNLASCLWKVERSSLWSPQRIFNTWKRQFSKSLTVWNTIMFSIKSKQQRDQVWINWCNQDSCRDSGTEKALNPKPYTWLMLGLRGADCWTHNEAANTMLSISFKSYMPTAFNCGSTNFSKFLSSSNGLACSQEQQTQRQSIQRYGQWDWN